MGVEAKSVCRDPGCHRRGALTRLATTECSRPDAPHSSLGRSRHRTRVRSGKLPPERALALGAASPRALVGAELTEVSWTAPVVTEMTFEFGPHPTRVCPALLVPNAELHWIIDRSGWPAEFAVNCLHSYAGHDGSADRVQLVIDEGRLPWQ